MRYEMNNPMPLAFIKEQVSCPSDYVTPFGYEMHERGNRFFLTFDAVLQSFGVTNRNNRIYESANVWERITNDPYIQTMLRQNSWMGELDHPFSKIVGQELTSERLANPDPKCSSHYIRSPRLNGNLLEAHIQTDSSNDCGMNFAIKIVDGKIIPSFSVRVIGGLKREGNKSIIVVRKLICYDAVLYPSHAEALGKVQQPMMEGVNAIEEYSGVKIIPTKELAKMAVSRSDETKWLMESFGLTDDDIMGVTDTGNSVIVKENANVILQPLTDASLRDRTRSMLIDIMK